MLTDEQYDTFVEEHFELFPPVAQRVIEFGAVNDDDEYELLKEVANALLAREEDSCKYAMLVFDLEEMTEARQCDRELLDKLRCLHDEAVNLSTTMSYSAILMRMDVILQEGM